MKVYQSNYINIEYKNGYLYQYWSGEQLTENIFKLELLNFLNIFLKYKPSNLLWDNRKFKFFISDKLNKWIEEEILIPQYQNGLKKLAFIVTKDVWVQQTVIKSVESFKPYVKPSFFLTEPEAISFLNENQLQSKNNKLSELKVEKLLDDNYQIRINIHKDNIEDTVIALNEIKSFQDYRNKNIDIYNALTLQEKIIIRKIVYGKTSRQIANSLNIQTDTIQTHRKNLKRKIGYQNSFELIYFAKAFAIVSF